MTHHHPIRDAEIITWRSADEDCPANYKWLARLTPLSAHPVTAHGQTRAECVGKLESFCIEAIIKQKAKEESK